VAKVNDKQAAEALEAVKAAGSKKNGEAYEKLNVADNQKVSELTVQQVQDIAEAFEYSPGGLLNKLLGVGQRSKPATPAPAAETAGATSS